MIKPIPQSMHGLADYLYAPLVSSAPEVIGFKKEKKAATLCQIICNSVLTYSVLTKAEWGLLRMIPIKVHLLLDASVGIFSLAAPWLFGFSGNSRARNTFLVMGAISMAASLLTQTEEKNSTGGEEEHIQEDDPKVLAGSGV